MEATLEWGADWLILVAGPWRISVASIEDDSDGAAVAHVYGWTAHEFGNDPPAPGSEDHAEYGAEKYERCALLCRSRVEAVAVIRALLSVRGVDCPDHPDHPSTPPPDPR